MKLLQVTYEVNTGIGRIAENIGLIANSNGFDSYITYSRAFQPSKSITIKVGNKLEMLFHVFLTRFFDLHGLGSFWATKRLIKKIKKIAPDIIILHNIHGYYLNYSLLFRYLKQENDIPVYWVLHDCWAFTGHCTYFEYSGCTKWRKECSNCPLIHDYPKSLFFDLSKFHYHRKKSLFNIRNLTLVPVSNWLANLVKQSFLKDLPLQVIHNGIDINVFHPDKRIDLNGAFSNNKKYYVLGVAAVWDMRKGLQFFVDLASQLDGNYQIVIVGLTDSQLSSLPENIIGLKRTSSAEELAKYYASSNVFVNPTLEDNYPTTNLEAIACGTPVITFNTGGSPESISSDTGLVVEQGNIEELKKAIVTVCERGKDYYTKNCRKRAIDVFDMNVCFNQYFELINKNG